MNTIGQIFRLTSFGESHGAAIGGVVDGMPAGIDIDETFIQNELNRRRPGQSSLTTARSEADKAELLSGILEGRTTGQPIGFIVRNTDQHPHDYDAMREALRPSHADLTYMLKYGIRDHRGGGRSSARETVSRVVAGALAKTVLHRIGISITAYTSQVGDIRLPGTYTDYDLSIAETNDVRCPDAETASEMERLIMNVKSEGDTIGGIVTCVVRGCPAGLGEPVFGKLHARLGNAMLTINAVKAFEYGDGFEACRQRGSEQNDLLLPGDGCPRFASNHSGGIQGGISNGQDIVMRIGFKPVATLLQAIETTDINGHAMTLNARGRHDACVLPRAVPVVEAMAAMVILDNWLLNKTNNGKLQHIYL